MDHPSSAPSHVVCGEVVEVKVLGGVESPRSPLVTCVFFPAELRGVKVSCSLSTSINPTLANMDEVLNPRAAP